VIPDAWRALVLAPPRAFAAPRCRATMRRTPEDFVVEEQLGFAPSGAGEHVLLRVRKRDANTGWVARELATLAGTRPHDVGYAGMKDRHAIATQWFTVPGRRRPAADWAGVRGEGFEVLEAHAHSRKLPRGALAGNRFAIVLRDLAGDTGALEAQVRDAAQRGVPNYFGPQRFGRDLSNLSTLLALPAGRAPARFVLSAARSLLFNAVLAARVADGSWNQLRDGDRANLDGRNSVFAVPEVDQTLARRVVELDLHPTGPLWGLGDPGVTGEVAALEAGIVEAFPEARAAILAAGAEAARRPLRLAVRDLQFEWLEPGRACRVCFSLRSGSFATAVIREWLDADGAPQEDDDA
jgi:tRNA pseudouridine13 synthase